MRIYGGWRVFEVTDIDFRHVQIDLNARLFQRTGNNFHFTINKVHAIDLILDHMHLIDNKMKIISGALEKSGVKVNLDMPELDVSNLEDPPSAEYPQRDKPKGNS